MPSDNDRTAMQLDALLRTARSVTISNTIDGDVTCVVHRVGRSMLGESTVKIHRGADVAAAVESACLPSVPVVAASAEVPDAR